MPPVDYKRLASEWRVLLDWYESGQKETLKKVCGDDNKMYNNCIGHNKVLRTHEDKAEQVRVCRKKVAEYEQKDEKKSSTGGSVSAHSEELSNLKKQVATLLERNTTLEHDYNDMMDAVKDVQKIFKDDGIEHKDDDSDDDSDATSKAPFNGLDFISMAEDYVERNDKLFNEQSAELVKEREAKRKALQTVVKHSSAIKLLEEQLAKVTAEKEMLAKAIMEHGGSMVKKTEEVLGETDDSDSDEE
jgi:hypothetical protein